jgi:hypothetical protein
LIKVILTKNEGAKANWKSHFSLVQKLILFQ